MRVNSSVLRWWDHLALALVSCFFLMPLQTHQDVVVSHCGHPPVPTNAIVSLTSESLGPGTAATYSCDEGYQLFGTATIVCSPYGKWSGKPPYCATNIAYQKPANQSSTVKGGDATNANDGDTTNVHDGRRCTQTLKGTSPFWKVDLLRPYEIRAVKIILPACCDLEIPHDLEVRVGNQSEVSGNQLCAWNPGSLEAGSINELECARPVIGRFVSIQMAGIEGALSLCEVEVFTTKEFSSDRCSAEQGNSHVTAYNRSCYEFQMNDGGSFDEAREYCTRKDGDLLHPLLDDTFTFVKVQLDRVKKGLQTQLVWIGAQKEPGRSSITWRWVNDDLVKHPLWGKDQPNNYNGEQNCMVLDGGREWLWNDVGCNLDYLHWICQYYPSNCGSPDKKENTTIIGGDYSKGSVIEYKCPIDFQVLGQKTRLCQDNGFWSGEAPTCKYVDCGEVDSIEFGEVVLREKRTTFNATVYYSCQDDYTLVGSKVRSCQGNGSWSGETPKCLFNQCPKLSNPVNGNVQTTGMSSGDRARFHCFPGHKLVGVDTLTCELGGFWTGEPPVCDYIDCDRPDTVDHGVYRLLNGTTTFRSVIEYQCAEDYWLDGPKHRTCMEDGSWNLMDPICQIISCGEPIILPGSYVTGYDFTVNSEIEYHCEEGHLLHGESTRVCTYEANWSGDVPECKYVDCGRVQTILYGTISYPNDTTHLGSMVRYTCSRNYRILGDQSRTCGKDGQWSGQTPKCEEIRCGEPERPEHTVLDITGNDRIRNALRNRIRGGSSLPVQSYRVGTRVGYACEAGYKLDGYQARSCLNTGDWSYTAPNCIYVDCGVPHSTKNGEYSLPNNATYYGSTALYKCADNYKVIGNSRRTCLENGTWGGVVPQCEEILCGDPENPSEVYNVQVSNYTVSSTATYTCAKGRKMIGESVRVCQTTGVWGGIPPKCEWVDCGEPNLIENGRRYLINQSTLYDSWVEYHCVPNYRRRGIFVRVCQENGKWSDTEPLCVEDNGEDFDDQNSLNGPSNVAAGKNQDDLDGPRAIGVGVGVAAGVVLIVIIVISVVCVRVRVQRGTKDAENSHPMNQREKMAAPPPPKPTYHDNRLSTLSGLSNIYENINEEEEENNYEDMSRHKMNGNALPPIPPSTSSLPGSTSAGTVTINGVAVQ